METRTPDLRVRWTLDPGITFLNHGSFGACPERVLEYQAELRARMEREPVLFLGRELESLLDAAKVDLAAFVGADPEDIGFVPNATTGVNAVVRSLALDAGDELLVTDHAYNACRNALEFVASRAGARVVVAEIPFPIARAEQVVETVLEHVSPKTRLALIDHVTSETGLVYPIGRIVAALRERGVETLVDGAHAPGMVPLDIAALGAGYYTGNCHKWICAPKGAAFLHVRRDLQTKVRPTVISHGANATRTDRSRFRIEFDWVGTDDPTAYLSVPEALRHMGSLVPGGWDGVRATNRALALEARTLLLAALGIPAPAPEDMLATLVSLPLPGAPARAPDSAFDIDPLQRKLFDEHRIEVPVMVRASGRLLRISAQLYNRIEDYEKLASALTR